MYSHAVDVSQSVPGAPFWQPGFGVFDAHTYARRKAQDWVNGHGDPRIKYMVIGQPNGPDIIFDPSVSLTWRQNGSYKTEHRSHLHVSFTVAAEQSTAPFFVPEDDDMTPAEFRALMDGPTGYRAQIKSDTNAAIKARLADTVPELVKAAVEEYVDHALGGYVNGKYVNGALREAATIDGRKKYGLSS